LRILSLAGALLLATSTYALAGNQTTDHSHHHNHHASGHDHSARIHAPIGIMGDHLHDKGDWMFSYRYMNMEMDGNRDGNRELTPAETRAEGFMVAPLNMTMEMHMFGVMYGLTEDLTVMAMAPYVIKEMDHETGALVHFTTETEGISDVKVSGIYGLSKQGDEEVLLNFGVSLPTGSISERGDTPMGSNQKLPYPMQLGSGTVDPTLGITYTNVTNNVSWGGQANTTLRFGENDEDYRLGNEYNATAWVATKFTDWVHGSLRIKAAVWGDIQGSDPQLNPAVVPTARADLRGGERVETLIGFSIADPSGAWSGHRLALEAGLPVYQNLDGPQMQTDYTFNIGWQYAF